MVSMQPSQAQERALLVERKIGGRIDSMLILGNDAQLAEIGQSLQAASNSLRKNSTGFMIRPVTPEGVQLLSRRWGADQAGSFLSGLGQVAFLLNPSPLVPAQADDPSAGEIPASYNLFVDVFGALQMPKAS